MTTTIGRYLHLPTAGAGSSHYRTDQPLGAGLAQIAASNGTHLARENGLRQLYDDPGSALVGRALSMPGAGVESFDWDRLDSAEPAGFARFCGVHQIRPWGETRSLPRVELRCRAGVGSAGGQTGGLILVVTPGCVHPAVGRHPYVPLTFTDALTDRALTLTLPNESACKVERWTPRVGSSAVPPEAAEVGSVLTIGVWVGAWSTSNQDAHPIEVRGLTIYLREPA